MMMMMMMVKNDVLMLIFNIMVDGNNDDIDDDSVVVYSKGGLSFNTFVVITTISYLPQSSIYLSIYLYISTVAPPQLQWWNNTLL